MIYIIQYGVSGITAKLSAIHSGSRKMRCGVPSPPDCSATAPSAWPWLANCSWQR